MTRGQAKRVSQAPIQSAMNAAITGGQSFQIGRYLLSIASAAATLQKRLCGQHQLEVLLAVEIACCAKGFIDYVILGQNSTAASTLVKSLRKCTGRLSRSESEASMSPRRELAGEPNVAGSIKLDGQELFSFRRRRSSAGHFQCAAPAYSPWNVGARTRKTLKPMEDGLLREGEFWLVVPGAKNQAIRPHRRRNPRSSGS